MKLDGLKSKERTEKLRYDFNDQLKEFGRRGLFGAARFSEVLNALIPVQQEKLRSICGHHFDELFSIGSVVSIAVAYDEDVIRTINEKSSQGVDINKWNVYASEYDNINSILNEISKKLADKIDGIAIPATWENQETKQFQYIRETFGDTVSHRAVAEIAGLGWRGKNGLIINEEYSCAIRFASIIVPFILDYGQQNTMNCGECTACEIACSFIRNRSILSDYRDYCMRYIDHLKSKGLKYDVCGKCIKACYFNSIYSKQFQL
jgi:epoxyqueuosine reductase QueG